MSPMDYRTSQCQTPSCLVSYLQLCITLLLLCNSESFIITPKAFHGCGSALSPSFATTNNSVYAQTYKKRPSAKFLFFADDTVVEEEEDFKPSDSSGDVGGIKIASSAGDASSINKAAEFMVDSFWLGSPQQLVVGADTVSSAARSGLCEAQAQDLMEKYGERLGKRLLDSCLLVAVDNETDEDDILGIVTVQMDLLDRNLKEILGAEKSEPMLKNAVASLGPKQRRQYKDSSVTELATELLPPEISAVCVLSNLAISPDARRRGLAVKLCTEAARIVKEEWGFEQMFLRVETENTAARGLYENKLGFEQEFISEGAIAVRVDAGSGRFIDIEADTLTLSKYL